MHTRNPSHFGSGTFLSILFYSACNVCSFSTMRVITQNNEDVRTASYWINFSVLICRRYNNNFELNNNSNFLKLFLIPQSINISLTVFTYFKYLQNGIVSNLFLTGYGWEDTHTFAPCLQAYKYKLFLRKWHPKFTWMNYPLIYT